MNRAFNNITMPPSIIIRKHAQKRWEERKMPASRYSDVEDMVQSMTCDIPDFTTRLYMKYLNNTSPNSNRYYMYVDGYLIIYGVMTNGTLSVITVIYLYTWRIERELIRYYGEDYEYILTTEEKI